MRAAPRALPPYSHCARERPCQLGSAGAGVAAVYDVGVVDDGSALTDDVSAASYAISEWTAGRTLAQIMETGPQPWQRGHADDLGDLGAVDVDRLVRADGDRLAVLHRDHHHRAAGGDPLAQHRRPGGRLG